MDGLISQTSGDLSAFLSPNTSVISAQTKSHKRKFSLVNEMTNLRENSFIGNEEIEFKMNLFKNNSMTRRQSCSDRFAYQGPDAVDHF